MSDINDRFRECAREMHYAILGTRSPKQTRMFVMTMSKRIESIEKATDPQHRARQFAAIGRLYTEHMRAHYHRAPNIEAGREVLKQYGIEVPAP